MESFGEDSNHTCDEAAEDRSKVHAERHSNGHQLQPPSIHQANRSGSPKMHGRKPAAFNRAFKQAVFQKRGKEDGTSNLHVTFTSPKGAIRPVTVARQLAVRDQQQHRNNKPFTKITGLVNIKPKPKSGPSMYKDLVTIDKKKMQEEIESMPKPDHIVEAEKVLLSSECIKKFSRHGDGGAVYICKGCDDTFPSQFALDDHLSRQSYQLTLDCPQCLNKCTFSNKCKMYEHLHGEHGVDKTRSSQIATMFVTLHALPRAQIKLMDMGLHPGTDVSGHLSADEKMEDSETDEVPAVDDMTGEPDAVNHEEDAQVNKSTDNVAADEVNDEKDSEQEIIISAPIISEANDSDDQDGSVSCTECSRTFESAYTLQSHFTLPTDEDFKPEVCIPCKVELVTPCARKAHMRIHGLIEPFVCPDCGQRMYKKNVFLKHIRLHCLHYSVLSEYTCPGCAETFSTADEQLVHLKVMPSHLRFERERSYYKCNGCPKAFKSVAAHSKHESCPGAGCSVVHMCNNCPQQTVFRSWTELTEHRSQAHPQLVWIPKRSKIFACYLCVHKSRTKQGLLEHLQKSHGKRRVLYMCQYCGVEMDTRQTLDTHIEACAFKAEAHNQLRAPLSIPERLPRLSSGSSVGSDVPPGTAVTENAASMNAVTEKEDAGDMTANAGTSSNAVTSENVAFLAHTPSFNCHICSAEYSTYSMLREHVTKRHEGRGLIYECWLCRDRGNTASFYRQSALDKHMTDVHKLQISPASPQVPVLNGHSPPEPEVPMKKMRLWNDEGQPYQCCRCDYSCISGSDFKDHVSEHKSSADSFQCVECGMCFTVQLALKRHLFAVHKVSDYSKYSRSQYMADFERQLHDTQGRCPICKKKFEEVQLRKHLRTHGMMYISTRRLPTNSAQ